MGSSDVVWTTDRRSVGPGQLKREFRIFAAAHDKYLVETHSMPSLLSKALKSSSALIQSSCATCIASAGSMRYLRYRSRNARRPPSNNLHTDSRICGFSHLYRMGRQHWDYGQLQKFGSHAGEPGHPDGVQ